MKKALYLILITALTWACHNKNSSSTEPAQDNVQQPVSENTQKTETPKETEKTEEATSDGIKWMTYDEAVKAAKKKPRKIFVDVYTNWCGWCKKMDKTTFKDAKITAYMNKNYYAVKLDAESSKTITYQGKEMTEQNLASRVFKVSGYPSTVYLEPGEKIIQPVPGYMDVPTLDKILHYIGEDHYKTQTWEQFQMSYKE